MRITNRILLGFVATLALVCSLASAGEQGKPQDKNAKTELPPAVAKAVQDNRPHAEIDKVEVVNEASVTLYDIEFKAGAGEIEVAEDGTVMDIATIVEMKDIPKAAAEALQKAAEGARITQLEKSDVRAEIKTEGAKGRVVKLANPRYVFEAELEKGNQTGEIEVAPDGTVIEAAKWTTKGAGEKEGKLQEGAESCVTPAVSAQHLPTQLSRENP